MRYVMDTLEKRGGGGLSRTKCDDGERRRRKKERGGGRVRRRSVGPTTVARHQRTSPYLRCVRTSCDVVRASPTSPARDSERARPTVSVGGAIGSEAPARARLIAASSGRAARTGGNLCRARIPVFARAEGSRLRDTRARVVNTRASSSSLSPDGLFKDFRPGSRRARDASFARKRRGQSWYPIVP